MTILYGAFAILFSGFAILFFALSFQSMDPILIIATVVAIFGAFSSAMFAVEEYYRE